MRINPTNSITLPAAEAQEILPLFNQRVPRGEISSDWDNLTLPALVLGQEIDAIVLALLPDDHLVLDLGGTAVQAESSSNLSAGQHLRLRVEQLQPQLVLHITEAEPRVEIEAARLLRAHLPAHADAGELLEQLFSRIQSESHGSPISPTLTGLKRAITTILADGQPPTVEKLKILTRDGGIFYEAKMFDAAARAPQALSQVSDKDLKGLLLSALKEAEGGIHSGDFKNAVSAQLNNIETQQAVNLLAQLDGSAFQLQIPFFTQGRFSTAAVLAEEDENRAANRQGKGMAGYHLLFLLDLENFGRTRIDAHVTQNEIKVVFYVDRESSIKLLNQEIPSFHDLLSAMGYREVLLVAKPLKDIPEEKRQKFDAIAIGAPTSIHLVDVKV